MGDSESNFLNPNTAVRMAGVHEGMRVADFGSGSGFFARAAARAVGDAGVVWAVDTQRELLSRIKNFAAAEALNNVEVLHGDVEIAGGTALPEDSFDFAIVANILFSLENKGECLAEVRRILKKSGRALIIDWAGSFGGLGPQEDQVVTLAEGKKLCESHSFTVLGSVPAGAYHWGFVIRKKAP